MLQRMLFVPVVVLIAASHAHAMPASCQVDFKKFSEERQSALERINGFNKKRPTAQVACGAFNNLSDVETRFLKWMSDNKDWCQIPDDFVNQFKGANGATQKARGQICTAARQQQEGGAAAAPRGAPPPGAGIRLPGGAL